jgi:uncharacterized protein YjiS (DUF1127 family)
MNKSSKNNQCTSNRSLSEKANFGKRLREIWHLHRLRAAYKLGRERYRQRRQLMEMDDRQLKDIGITRDQAEQEARKPIWKD